jgi:hypothetical protein
MRRVDGWLPAVAAALICVSIGTVWTSANSQAQKPKPKPHPKLTVRANPELGMAPLRVVATAELAGGADDDQDYYCMKVQWRWGDDSDSTTEADCDPYVAGKSEIKRHFAMEHRYKEGGKYELFVLFKQGDKTIDSGRVVINVQGQPKPTPAGARLRVPRPH